MKEILAKITFVVIVIAILIGTISSQLALLFGFIFTQVFKKSNNKIIYKVIGYFLRTSVIGLGFGMYIKETLDTTKGSFALTFYSITLTVCLGLFLTKLLKLDLKLGYLITSGTSICGGSAIAAISPIIKVNSKIISIAIGIIFLLNSIAVFVFPAIGQLLNLTQEQFGLWCAIAIHDTSSVVGATLDFGDESLKIATIVKLSRTLWIVPLSIFSLLFFQTKGARIKLPLFILLFILAIFANSYHLIPSSVTSLIFLSAKRLLVLSLFLIGSTISIIDLKSTGLKPIFLALSLWMFISIFSLGYIIF